MTDTLPPEVAIPLALLLCIVWRRQTVVARRAGHKPNEQEQER